MVVRTRHQHHSLYVCIGIALEMGSSVVLLLGLGVRGHGVARAHDVLIAECVIDTTDVGPELGLAQPVDREGSLVARVRVVPLVTGNHLCGVSTSDR